MEGVCVWRYVRQECVESDPVSSRLMKWEKLLAACWIEMASSPCTVSTKRWNVFFGGIGLAPTAVFITCIEQRKVRGPHTERQSTVSDTVCKPPVWRQARRQPQEVQREHQHLLFHLEPQGEKEHVGLPLMSRGHDQRS